VQPGAAGVSQPWFRKHAYSGNIAIVAHGRPAGCLSTNTVATALPDPRQAHARRSCERAFLHRKNRFFADKCSHCNKSGGRKPPVERIPHASSRRRSSPHCRCTLGLQTHGRLTPAALGCVFAGPRTLLDSRRTAFSFPYHSGLTKAAPGSAGVAASCLACGRFGRKMCQSPRAHRHKEHQKRTWKGSRNSMRAICAPTQRTPEADLERFTQLYENYVRTGTKSTRSRLGKVRVTL
jgi:hypothetical protein